METQPTLYVELIKALPVIIGGLLAIVGGVAGQILTHRLSSRGERNKLLSSRVEAFVKALYAHSQWLSDKFSIMVYRCEDHNEPSPLDEARMLQSLYFPELHAEIAAVMGAQQPLIKFIWEQRIARMKNQEDWIKTFDRTPYDEAYKLHLTALSQAVNKCSTLVKHHLGS